MIGDNFRGYRDLEVWQKAMVLTRDCYAITRSFPKREHFGLTGQLRRAAVSVPANIAEGRALSHTKQFMKHLSIANGSLAELETHFQLSKDLGYIEEGNFDRLVQQASEVGRMLHGLRHALEKRLAVVVPGT